MFLKKVALFVVCFGAYDLGLVASEPFSNDLLITVRAAGGGLCEGSNLSVSVSVNVSVNEGCEQPQPVVVYPVKVSPSTAASSGLRPRSAPPQSTFQSLAQDASGAGEGSNTNPDTKKPDAGDFKPMVTLSSTEFANRNVGGNVKQCDSVLDILGAVTAVTARSIGQGVNSLSKGVAGFWRNLTQQ